jgi:hypothetical protein
LSDRTLRRTVLGTGFVVWAFAIGIAAIRLPFCNSSYATGRVIGALFVGFLVAGIGSILWNAIRRRRARFTVAFLASAAIVSASIQLAAFANEQADLDAVLARGEACLAAGTPFQPVEGLTYAPPPPALAAGLEASMPDDMESLLDMRLAHRNGRPVAIVLAAAIGNDYTDQSSFQAGIMASTGGSRARVGRHAAVVKSVPGRTLVSGFTGCYGLVVVSPSEARAHSLFKVLARRAPGPGSPA